MPAHKFKKERSSSSSSSDDSPPPPKKVIKIEEKTSPQKRKRASSPEDSSDSDRDARKNQVPRLPASSKNNNKIAGNKAAAAAASTSNATSTTKMTNQQKKKAQMDDDSDRDEHAERESSFIQNGGQSEMVMPRDIFNFCKFILDLGEQNKIHLAHKKGHTKFSLLVRDSHGLQPNIDLTAMQSSFNLVYRWATLLSEVPLTDALKRVMDFVQTEQILHKFPSYPKVMISSWNIYCRNLGITSFKATKKLQEKFKNKQDKEVIKAEEEFQQCLQNNVAQFREFLERHRDQLFQCQIDCIQTRIHKMERSMAAEPKEPKIKKAKAVPAQKPTPFELYMKTVDTEGKYAELSAEDRNAKFLRRFNKLPEEQKRIYEIIAEKY